MAPTNKAAFYPSDKAPALTIGPSPYPTPSPNEVIIRVSATAINPIDQKVQDLGTTILPFLTYPLVGGFDVAGTVVEAGSAVADFRPGDRVLAFPTEFASRTGGFQHYVAVQADCVARIPKDTPFTDAAVLPTGISTAAVAFRYLGLDLSLEDPVARAPTSEGAEPETVLVTAGAGSVGSNAIQLAVAAGYEVIATSSTRNFAHCASLGAARVFDYASPTLASELKAALRGRRLAGALSCVAESNAVVFEAVAASEGSKRVACTLLFSQDEVPEAITAEMIHAYWIKDTPLAETIFGKFLPQALASGKYKCEPKPLVVGKGLESVQAAFDLSKKGGVSCQKLVVVLEGEA
ncbi:GroES-like protein [Xylaria cf. heliscus]|nr:GroES-like protein [Xylaria cf. heliscus]